MIRSFLRTSRSRGRHVSRRLWLQSLERRETPATFTVSSINDAGAGSFRQAIIDANAAAGDDTIVFDATFNSAQTIALTSGQLPITSNVSIVGPGSGLLTVQSTAAASATSRLLNITGSVVSVSGMVLTGGNLTGTNQGAGILVGATNLSLTDVRLTGNTTADDGGGLSCTSGAATITLNNCTVAGNTATGTTSDGGGLRFASAGNLILRNSTVSGNSTARNGGGIYFFNGGKMTIENSTVSGNVSGGTGGGVYFFGTASAPIEVRNSTITGNISGSFGGGFYVPYFYGTFNLNSSIVALNTAATDPDLSFDAAFVLGGGNNLVGVADVGNFTLSGSNLTGTLATPLDPLLNPLANNGGLTQTHSLQVGSPAIDAGNNVAGLTFDQRGTGNPRTQGVAADVGSFEAASVIPSVTMTPLGPITVGGATPDVVSLSFLDDLGIAVATIGIGNIEIIDPLSNKLTILSVTPTPNSNAKSIVADYKFAVPGGTWGGEDAGVYTVNMLASQVSDIDGTTHFVAAGTVGTFTVDIATTFVVDNTGDIDDGDFTAGNQTLREAIGRANKGALSTDTITFSPTVFASASTITLSNGEYLVQSPMTINGPLANLTIDAGGVSRHFNVDGPGSGNAVEISRVGLVNGFSGAGNGGSILNVDEALTLTSVSIFTSVAVGDGGAISINTAAGSLSIDNGFLSGNVASGTGADGGAINISGNSKLTIVRTTISGNMAGRNGGGIYFFSGGTLTMDDTTVSQNLGNVEASGNGGGGIYLFSSTATIRNSTISSNKTNSNAFTGNGGGIVSNSATTLSVLNSTVAFNEAAGNGGGISNSGASTITVTSTILSNNTATGTGPDFNGTAAATYSLLSNSANATISPASATNILDQDAKLLPLGANGGPTLTHLLGSGSPARNKGSNPAPALVNDQRGVGFARVLQGTIDMGSTESTDPAPIGSLTPVGAIVTPGATPNTVVVTYSDSESLINVSTIGTGDIEILDPLSNKLSITKATVDINTNGTPRVVTYEFSVPGGAWDAADNGAYTVNMLAGEVFDTDAIPVSVPAGKLGGFTVSIGASFVVNATNDESSDTDMLMSLREAVILANGNANPGSTDTITFDPTVFATAKTITLTLGEFSLTEQVSIQGPTAGVTIDAALSTRHFNIDVPTLTAQKVSLSDMSLTNGVALSGNGGSIFNADEALTLTKVSVSGNIAGVGDGGGIALGATAASLTLVDSTVSNNQALDVAGTGGGIFMQGASAVVVQRSSVTGNLAGQNGGGIYFFNGGSFTMTDSTVSGNKSGQTVTTGLGGAGIYFYGTAGTFLVQNSTISSNEATNGFGAGVILNAFGGTATFRNSTIAFNSLTSAAGKGGGIASTGNLVLESTIVTGNTAVGGSQNVYQLGVIPVVANNSLIGVLDAGDIAVLTGAGNLTGTTATPLDAKLDPTLALNGAPAGSPLTHALLAGSPAINAGNNGAALAFDQRGPGFARVSGGTADIGAFEVQTATAPIVTSIEINGGAAQRSRVTSVKVNFDSPVTIANPNAAFTLNRVTPAAGAVTLNVVLDGSGLFATITFTGGLVDGAGTISSPFSIQDGRYTLSVVPSEFGGGGINGNAGVLVSNSFNSTPYVDNLTPATGIFRMFGDATGNGKVESDDFLAFRIAFLSSNDAFDFNGNGQVDSATDLLQFRLHFLQQVL